MYRTFKSGIQLTRTMKQLNSADLWDVSLKADVRELRLGSDVNCEVATLT